MTVSGELWTRADLQGVRVALTPSSSTAFVLSHLQPV
jgi:hypothetical protein